jgi:RNA polymerase-interacting CarD/CdnL/TRCF family regulator
MAKKLAYQRGFLLFHSSHGPCRITDIIKQTESGGGQYYYSLESKQPRFKRARFLVDSDQVEASGFHLALSPKEANQILDYLKTSDPSNRGLGKEQSEMILGLIKKNTPWAFSRVILIFSLEKDGKAAKGKREMLDRAAKGLIRELSFALEIPEEEAFFRMKKSLKRSKKTNPWVLDTISHSLVDV